MSQIEKIKQFEYEYSTECYVISKYKDITWEYVKEKMTQ